PLVHAPFRELPERTLREAGQHEQKATAALIAMEDDDACRYIVSITHSASARGYVRPLAAARCAEGRDSGGCVKERGLHGSRPTMTAAADDPELPRARPLRPVRDLAGIIVRDASG